MHRYSPSPERIRDEWMRRCRLRRRPAKATHDTPDNSTPWSSTLPRRLADLIAIADTLNQLEQQWGRRSKPS